MAAIFRAGRVGVIGRLVQVDVADRAYGIVVSGRPTENLKGPIGQDLVDIHIRRRAGPSLKRIDLDMLI